MPCHRFILDSTRRVPHVCSAHMTKADPFSSALAHKEFFFFFLSSAAAECIDFNSWSIKYGDWWMVGCVIVCDGPGITFSFFFFIFCLLCEQFFVRSILRPSITIANGVDILLRTLFLTPTNTSATQKKKMLKIDVPVG